METNKEQQPISTAGVERRIVAFAIDHLIVMQLMIAIVFFSMESAFMDAKNALRLLNGFPLIIIGGFILYFAKDSIKGISLGKWIMGIRVRNAEQPDQTPSVIKLFIRNLSLIIWPIEFFILTTSQDKRRIGDKAANTIVVPNPNRPSKILRVLALMGVVSVLFVSMFFSVASLLKNSDAYKVAVQGIEQNETIVRETGGITGYGVIPTGNIKIVNGTGTAELRIKVLGEVKDLNVNVKLTKVPNSEWQLIDVE